MNETPVQPQFHQVATELAEPLLRYLTRQIGDPMVAEDLRQETLLRIERGLPNFAGRAQLKTWAFSIAGNVVADYLRQPQHRLKLVDIEEAANASADDQTLDEQLVIDEMNSCVRGVIDSLPPDYRTALILHDLEGMTAEQTADVSQCSLATAKIRIHRARQRLKDALQRQCDFYRDTDDVFRCSRVS